MIPFLFRSVLVLGAAVALLIIVLQCTQPIKVSKSLLIQTSAVNEPSGQGGFQAIPEEFDTKQSETPKVEVVSETIEPEPKIEVLPSPTKELPAEEPLSPELLAAKQSADDLFDGGKYQEAYAAYEKLEYTRNTPKEFIAQMRFQRGLCRFKEKRNSEAFSIWSGLRSAHPQSIYGSRSLYIESEDPIKKERLYDEILRKYPTSDEAALVLEKRGTIAFEKKEYKKAFELWTRLTTHFPNHPNKEEIQRKFEILELTLGGDKNAVGLLESESLLKRGEELFNKAAFAQAELLFQDLLRKHPGSKKSSRAAGRLAQCQMALGKEREAFDTLQRMVDKSPENAATILGEIVIYAANTKNQEALRQCATQQLIQKYPKTFEAEQAIFISGNIAMARKDRVETQKWWKMLLEKYPETAFRTTVERELALLSGQPIRESPRLSKSQQNVLARLEATKTKKEEEKQRIESRKHWEKELEELEKAYRDPAASLEERTEIAFQMAERFFYLEKYEKAVDQYQKVWRQFPESYRGQEAAFRAAEVWFAADQSKKGEEQVFFFINRFPQSNLRPIAIFCMGNRMILYEGDLEKAWEFYHRLMTEYPQHPVTEQARMFWAKVKELPKQKLKEQVADFVEKHKQKRKV